MLSFVLTFSPDECQSKSFEKMITLLSAIFKFCYKISYPLQLWIFSWKMFAIAVCNTISFQKF